MAIVTCKICGVEFGSLDRQRMKSYQRTRVCFECDASPGAVTDCGSTAHDVGSIVYGYYQGRPVIDPDERDRLINEPEYIAAMPAWMLERNVTTGSIMGAPVRVGTIIISCPSCGDTPPADAQHCIRCGAALNAPATGETTRLDGEG